MSILEIGVSYDTRGILRHHVEFTVANYPYRGKFDGISILCRMIIIGVSYDT